MVLTNAIWFKDAWHTPFSKRATTPADRSRSGNGQRVEVPTMQVHKTLSAWAGNNDWQCLVLSFANSTMQFEVIVPCASDDGGLGSLAAAEDALLAGAHLAELEAKRVAIRMPRFRVSGSHRLVDALAAIGVKQAFTPQADFTSIDEEGELRIGEVAHKVWLDVDEKGAEAAAATAIVMRAGSARPDRPIQFDADRPFAFGLRDAKTGLLWFVGRVEDPRGDS